MGGIFASFFMLIQQTVSEWHRSLPKNIDLPAFANLKVRYAMQVLSQSVAAVISTMVTLIFQTFDPVAIETALFVEHMDKLFNTCTGVALTFEKLRIANAQHGKNCVSSPAAKTTISTNLPEICPGHNHAGLQTTHRPF